MTDRKTGGRRTAAQKTSANRNTSRRKRRPRRRDKIPAVLFPNMRPGRRGMLSLLLILLILGACAAIGGRAGDGNTSFLTPLLSSAIDNIPDNGNSPLADLMTAIRTAARSAAANNTEASGAADDNTVHSNTAGDNASGHAAGTATPSAGPETATTPSAAATDSPPADGSSFAVHFIDVGQGDSSLILCDGHAMLIDGGTGAYSDTIYRYLEQLGIDYLDYIVCSHPHADHAGGLAGALHFARAGIALAPVASYENAAFTKFTVALEEQGVSVTVPAVGDTYMLGSASVTVLGPTDWIDDNINNDSLILRIAYGETSFLFTGDAEQEEEQLLLHNEYAVLDSTVWKVSHHGSSNGASYAFIAAVDPDYAVISCGKDNSYGHPHEETLSLLQANDTAVYRTDLQGDVICTSDGTSVSFSVSRNAGADVWQAGQ